MALTQINDTWYNADGSLLNALLIITPKPAIVYSETHSVTPSKVSYWVNEGVVDFSLEANDVAQPSGSAYFVFVNAGCPWYETWTVPTSTAPVSLAAVRASAQSLRRATYFTNGTSWFLPASRYGTATAVPIILLQDKNQNQLFATINRNLLTGDTTINWANSQAGSVEVLLSPLQYTQSITAVTSITITALEAGLMNLIGIVVLNTNGTYVINGIDITFSLIASSPVTPQAAVTELGSISPFGSNFQGAFYAVTLTFAVPQSGKIVLLGS